MLLLAVICLVLKINTVILTNLTTIIKTFKTYLRDFEVIR